MFKNIINFFKKTNKKETTNTTSKETAKERLHLVLMQDRANVSADFLDLMRQEIIDVIKKYIEVDESAIDVRLTNKENADGTNGAPALYANIPIVNIKEEAKNKINKEKKEAPKKPEKEEVEATPTKQEEKVEETKQEEKEQKIEENTKKESKENKKDETTKKKDNKQDKKQDEPKEQNQEEVKKENEE